MEPRAKIPDASTLNRLAGITQPTLVANGDNDTLMHTPNSHLLAEHLPNAELRISPDAGRYPERFADDVAEFLRGQISGTDEHAPAMSAWRQTLRGERAALGRSARRFAFGAHVSRSQAATAGGLRHGKQPFAKSLSESVPAGRANFPPCSSRLTDAGPTKSAEQATAGA